MDSRHTFYTYANWVYQIGVFVSRSSGLLYQVYSCIRIDTAACYAVIAAYRFLFEHTDMKNVLT